MKTSLNKRNKELNSISLKRFKRKMIWLIEVSKSRRIFGNDKLCIKINRRDKWIRIWDGEKLRNKKKNKTNLKKMGL